MTISTLADWLVAFDHRDANDYPFASNGERLPLELDPDFEWTTGPNDFTVCGGTAAWQSSYNRGAY